MTLVSLPSGSNHALLRDSKDLLAGDSKEELIQQANALKSPAASAVVNWQVVFGDLLVHTAINQPTSHSCL